MLLLQRYVGTDDEKTDQSRHEQTSSTQGANLEVRPYARYMLVQGVLYCVSAYLGFSRHLSRSDGKWRDINNSSQVKVC